MRQMSVTVLGRLLPSPRRIDMAIYLLTVEDCNQLHSWLQSRTSSTNMLTVEDRMLSCDYNLEVLELIY